MERQLLTFIVTHVQSNHVSPSVDISNDQSSRICINKKRIYIDNLAL